MRDQWLLTWTWARGIALSYSKPMWPIASEISAQYMVLLLAEMRAMRALKLPYRASNMEVAPDQVRVLITGGGLALPMPLEGT